MNTGKKNTAELLKEKGFEITFEKPIGEGKTVDVVATKNNKHVAIEIETGRSDILININKCLQYSFDKIILVAVNEQAETKIKKIIRENNLGDNNKLKVVCARRNK